MNRLYIVVRADLAPGLQIAQSCHALRAFAHDHPDLDAAWYREGNNLVVLTVADERALVTLMHDAHDRGIPLASFAEPDLDDQLTAVAFAEDVKPLVRRLTLALAS